MSSENYGGITICFICNTLSGVWRTICNKCDVYTCESCFQLLGDNSKDQKKNYKHYRWQAKAQELCDCESPVTLV